MTTLLLAKHDNHVLNDATSKSLTAALAIGSPVHVLVAGSGCRSLAEAAAKLDGIEKVLLAAPSTWGGAWRGRLGRVGGGHDIRSQVTLRRLPLSRRGHQPRRLALLPLSAQPAHGGRDAGGPRHRREP